MKSLLALFRQLEKEVRTPRERLPIDAFLPAADSLPTEYPDPPPSALPVQSREMRSAADEEEARLERRKLRRAAKAAPKKADPTAPLKLDEEIAEFMNRDKKEDVKEDEIADFLGGFDPSEFPEG